MLKVIYTMEESKERRKAEFGLECNVLLGGGQRPHQEGEN